MKRSIEGMIEKKNLIWMKSCLVFPKLNQEYMTSTLIKCHQKLTNY